MRENKQLLSPDAQKAFAMYEKAAVAAQQKGSKSIGTLEQFDKLIKDMGNVGAKPPTPTTPGGGNATTLAVGEEGGTKPPTGPTGPSTPAPNSGVDASAAKSLDELGRANPGPGSISGKEMAAAIKAATEDLDNQAAGKEYKQIAQFVKDNAGKLSPEAKAAFEVYQKAAKAAMVKGETGIPTPVYNKMVKEMDPLAGTRASSRCRWVLGECELPPDDEIRQPQVAGRDTRQLNIVALPADQRVLPTVVLAVPRSADSWRATLAENGWLLESTRKGPIRAP